MKNLLEKIENKVITSRTAKFLAIVAVCLFTLMMASSAIKSNAKFGKEESIEIIAEEVILPTKMDILKEMYHENSEDIIVAVDVLYIYGGPLVKSDIKTIHSYLTTYGLDTRDHNDSDEKFDLEIDAFVYIFNDELMLDESLKELVLKRQFLKDEMTRMEEE